MVNIFNGIIFSSKIHKLYIYMYIYTYIYIKHYNESLKGKLREISQTHITYIMISFTKFQKMKNKTVNT